MPRLMFNNDALMAANPEYAEALARGEPWALKHAQRMQSLSSGEPEGFRRNFDGTQRKWCGAACPFEGGCITCTLPENPEQAQRNRRRPQFKD